MILANSYFLPGKKMSFTFFYSVARRLSGKELLFGPHWVMPFYIIRSENYLIFTENCVLPLLGNPVSALSLGNYSPPEQVKTVSFFFSILTFLDCTTKEAFVFSLGSKVKFVFSNLEPFLGKIPFSCFFFPGNCRFTCRQELE